MLRRRQLLSLSLLLATACVARTPGDNADSDTSTESSHTQTTDEQDTLEQSGGGPPAAEDGWDSSDAETGPHETPHGLSWTVRSSDPELGLVMVGTDDTSNPYYGDQPCEEALPLLCIDAFPPKELPEGLSVDDTYGWSGGTVRLSEPVLGSELSSQEVADALCAELATGYEMAQFHHLTDDGGWNWWAYADLEELSPEAGRFWVRIRDQPANCWDQE